MSSKKAPKKCKGLRVVAKANKGSAVEGDQGLECISNGTGLGAGAVALICTKLLDIAPLVGVGRINASSTKGASITKSVFYAV